MKRTNMAAAMARLAMLATLLSATACEHKDLCFDHFDHQPGYATMVSAGYALLWEQSYEGQTDWKTDWPTLNLDFSYESLCPTVPTGLRLRAYNKSGNIVTYNMPPEGEEIGLPEGVNSMLFYNNDTEYIVFNDLETFAEANATTRSRHRSTYRGNPFYTPPRDSRSDEENTVNPPDLLFGHYIEEYVQNRVADPQQLAITMQPLVFTYVVRYRFSHGYEYVALARGAMAGMAASVYLHNGRTSKEAATVLYDCELKPWGIEAKVKSFGAPDFPNPDYSRAGASFGINLEVRLTNGKILNFYNDISDQILRQPHGGVVDVNDLYISDDDGKPAEGGGAFDVDVEGWGEFIDVPIVMN